MLKLHLARGGFGLRALGGFHLHDLVLVADAHPRQQRHHFALDPLQQFGEQLERFLLVFLLRLLLRIAAQMDALAQVIHLRQVLLPVLVQHVEHHVLFQHAHGVAAHLRLLAGEHRRHAFLDLGLDLPGVQFLVLLVQVHQRQLHAVLAGQLRLQARQVPLLVDRVRRHEALDQVADHVEADALDVVLDAFGFQQLVALLVDHLALVVVDVVEIQQVLADVEVVRFDLALRVGDLLGHQRRLDDVVFLQAHARHHLLHPVGREDAHQVVFQRQVEAGRTRISLAPGTAAQLVVDAPALMALGAHDVQPAGGLDFVVAHLPVGLQALAAGGVYFALRFQFGELDVQRTAQHDVGTAAGHVGGDGDRARTPGLGNDGRFALMLLRVEHFVRYASGGEFIAQQFRHLDRGGADQHRLAAFHAFLDFLDHRAVLAGAIEEHQVGMILAHHGAVGRDHHHFEGVDALELVSFGVRGAGHAGQLAVHAEQVLEGDAGQGLVLALDRDALLRFHCLVQAIRPAPARQGAAGEFIDDHHFVFAHDVIDVALVDRMRAQRRVQMVDHVDVLRGVQAVVLGQDAGAAQQRFGMLLAGFGQVHLLAFLVDPVVARALFLVLLAQRRHDRVDLVVQVRGVVGRAGDDQRGARFVDQDRVDLVDDGVVQAALEPVFLGQRHVVAQVVEAEFVVGAVADVAAVGRAFLAVRHARIDHAHVQAQEGVQLAHPGGVAAGQVVVDGDDVDALAFQRVQIHRQRCHQGLALAGAHLGDLAAVQDHAADQLDIEMAHAEHPHAGLAAHRKGFRQQLVQRLASSNPGLEFVGLGLQRLVGQRLHLRFQQVDLLDDAGELLEQAFVAAAEDAGEQAVEHGAGNPVCGARATGAARKAIKQNGRQAPVLGVG